MKFVAAAKYSVTASAPSTNNSSPTIRNCRILDNTGHGVDLYGASPILSHCLITANGGNGISMQTYRTGIGRQARTLNCQPVIENCIIVDNNQAAIEGGEPIIIDSIIDWFPRHFHNLWTQVYKRYLKGIKSVREHFSVSTYDPSNLLRMGSSLRSGGQTTNHQPQHVKTLYPKSYTLFNSVFCPFNKKRLFQRTRRN